MRDNESNFTDVKERGTKVNCGYAIAGVKKACIGVK